MRKIKQPEPNQGKKIAAIPSNRESTNKLKPVFSFEHLVKSHSVDECELQDKAALAVQLSKIGSLSWGEIQSLRKHGLGHEIIPRESIKASIPSVVTPDVNLLAFRFSGRKPMVGFRSDQIFYILFIDRDFTLYDHG